MKPLNISLLGPDPAIFTDLISILENDQLTHRSLQALQKTKADIIIVDCTKRSHLPLLELKACQRDDVMVLTIIEPKNLLVLKSIYEMGAYDYLSYPFNADEVKRRISSCELFIKNKLSFLHVSHKIPEVKLVKSTCDYLLKNMSEKLTLEKIAQAMGTNRSHLNIIFTQQVGLSVFASLRHQRLSKASFLLKHSNKTVREIAYLVGIDNSAQFSTLFKKEFSLTPKEYRKSLQRIWCITGEYTGLEDGFA